MSTAFSPARQNDRPAVPPLQSGDRLTQEEFHQRYRAYPSLRAELLEGVVYVSSPLFAPHAESLSRINFWAVGYGGGTPGVRVADNVSVQIDGANEVQPDVCLWIDEAHGGRVHVTGEGMLQGAPEFVVEIAASSASYDLHDKLNVYRRNGVVEYLVLLAHERQTVWYRLQDGIYRTVEPDAAGILRSKVLPGLWFHPTQFWQGDVYGLLAVLQQGLATEAHRVFRDQLQARTVG